MFMQYELLEDNDEKKSSEKSNVDFLVQALHMDIMDFPAIMDMFVAHARCA